MSPAKWISAVNSMSIVVKAGCCGSTYAHSDIAFEFASWISAEFKLYIIRDYKRLKYDENSRLSLGWNLNREISKINYRIHTDAIKEKPDPSRTHSGTDLYDLCQQSGYAERGSFRQDSKAMAGRKSG